MKSAQRLTLVVFLFGANCPFYGQWDDQTELYLFEASTQASWLGCGMSLADFNLDGQDDLTFANSDGTLVCYASQPDGSYALQYEIEGTAQIQGVAWFDADGDDDLDLILTRRFDRMQLFIRSGDNLFEEALDRGLPENVDWEARGVSIADHDQDGDLDVYVSMYHDGNTGLSENLLLNNDGSGYFEDVTAFAGVGNGIRHTFQAVWMDFDLDGDLDLWVVNDRAVYPNSMYQNLGNGTFVDVSFDINAAQGIWGMTATVGDPDHDGQLELFCTNVENEPNLYLDRVGDQYQEIEASVGLDGLQYSWGGCWVDADGDMWEDLMVATYRFPNASPYDNYFYTNAEEGGYFVNQSGLWPNEQTQLYCVGVCDLNGDLAPDVVGHGNAPFAQVLINTTSEQTDAPGRLGVRLCSVLGNRLAIGSRIELHAGGEVQNQWVTCGSDYMTQQSHTRYFATGEAEMVDSLIVHWPSGEEEAWYDLPVGHVHALIEGSTTAAISVEGSLCAGDSVTASSPFEAPEMLWNGVHSEDGTLSLDGPGTYVLECRWLGGLYVWTDTLTWNPFPPHALTVEWTEPHCHGDPGSLGWVADSGLAVVYDQGLFNAIEQGIQAPAGDLMLQTVDEQSGCEEMHMFSLNEPEPLAVHLEYSPAPCHDDVAQVSAIGFGGTPAYLLDWYNADPSNLPEGEVPFMLQDANGCTLDSSLLVIVPDPMGCEVTVMDEEDGDDGAIILDLSGGTMPYEVLWNDGVTGDTARMDLAAGLYSWVVQDANGCLLLGVEQIVNLDTPELTSGQGLTLEMDWHEVRLNSDDALAQGSVLTVLDLAGRQTQRLVLHDPGPWTFSREGWPSHGIVQWTLSNGSVHRWMF